MKSHTCDVCEKTFFNLGGLKNHKLLHTGEKNHSCAVCGKTFAQSGNLKVHQLIHARKKKETYI